MAADGETREVTAATADLGGADVVLTIGPQHPAAHGVLRLALRLDGDVVTAAEPLVGLLHRGAEKLFEVRDFRQVLVLANRHDWLSAFSSEVGVALAVERLLGLEVPERAVWGRTLLVELNRALAHLVFLGGFPPGGDPTDPDGRPVLAIALREVVQQVLEEATGGRMHFMANQVGGLKSDVPAGWPDRARRAVQEVRGSLPRLVDGVRADAAPFAGVGVLDRATALGYGASGPVARAGGLDLDLRRDDPCLAYGELQDVLRVQTQSEGDVPARLAVLAAEVGSALDLADACLDRWASLPPGPVNSRLPKVVRAPEGHAYVWTENPLGINGTYLVSRGERAPWRLKLRTASFNNVQALRAVLPGTRLEHLAPVLASFFFVVGDVDK